MIEQAGERRVLHVKGGFFDDFGIVGGSVQGHCLRMGAQELIQDIGSARFRLEMREVAQGPVTCLGRMVQGIQASGQGIGVENRGAVVREPVAIVVVFQGLVQFFGGACEVYSAMMDEGHHVGIVVQFGLGKAQQRVPL